MLLYKQGRFYAEGVSFVIPDGFYLDTSPDLCYETGITVLDPKQSSLYIFSVNDSSLGSKKALEELPQLGCQLLSNPTPISINGLHGHWLIWTFGTGDCYEAQFDLGNNKLFMLMVDACKCNIYEIMESEDFRFVFQGIQATGMDNPAPAP